MGILKWQIATLLAKPRQAQFSKPSADPATNLQLFLESDHGKAALALLAATRSTIYLTKSGGLGFILTDKGLLKVNSDVPLSKGILAAESALPSEVTDALIAPNYVIETITGHLDMLAEKAIIKSELAESAR